MRIGIVVDAACDLPPEWLHAAGIVLLPVTVRIGDTANVATSFPGFAALARGLGFGLGSAD